MVLFNWAAFSYPVGYYAGRQIIIRKLLSDHGIRAERIEWACPSPL